MTDWNFAAVWRGIAAAAPEREAVVCGDRRVTFGQFDDRARRLAWHLAQEAELERGDKVAIDVLNSPEYLETFFAGISMRFVWQKMRITVLVLATLTLAYGVVQIATLPVL